MSFVDGLALKNINYIEYFFLQISADPRENLLYYDYQEVKKAGAYTECLLTGAAVCNISRMR